MNQGTGGAPLGNQNAAKAKRWQKALERSLARAGGDVDAGLDTVADQVVTAAQKGDKDAWKEIGDRLDGRPSQIISGDSDGSPLVVQIVKMAEGGA